MHLIVESLRQDSMLLQDWHLQEVILESYDESAVLAVAKQNFLVLLQDGNSFEVYDFVLQEAIVRVIVRDYLPSSHPETLEEIEEHLLPST